MTPYRTDIDTNSFRPVTNGYVKVANDQHEPIIGIGNVTILIKCYETGMNITWTLFNVVVVPTIVRRLIATDELNDAGHSIGMEPSGIVLTLREHPNVPTQRKVTVLKYPRTWQYDSDAKEYQWPAAEYQFAVGTAPQGFLISPISLNLRQETVASATPLRIKLTTHLRTTIIRGVTMITRPTRIQMMERTTVPPRRHRQPSELSTFKPFIIGWGTEASNRFYWEIATTFGMMSKSNAIQKAYAKPVRSLLLVKRQEIKRHLLIFHPNRDAWSPSI
jgi:hypothetical protein